MQVTQDGTEPLDDYYVRKSDPVLPCEPSDKTKCCSLGPYGPIELFNYILKMLVLPGVIAAAIIFLALFAAYDNLVTQTISFVLSYVATLLIFIYRYEQIMGAINHITIGDKLPEGTFKLNETGDPTLKIGFIGDIMMMGDFELEIDPQVKRFFEGVDFIVGNLEGIITALDPSGAEQAHPKEILNQLYSLLSTNAKWLLCVSNNHSIDFGNNKFIESIKTIQNHKDNQNHKKFSAIGRNDVPRAFLGDDFCLSTATKWSNQKTWKCTSRFRKKELDDYYSKERFNILYPHWGYENEKYARRRIQKKAKKLLTRDSERNAERKKMKWDLIFGHHPHTRQPIVKIDQKDDNGNVLFKKLVAFSGGNFSSGAIIARRKKHIHGIIMRCEIGPLSSDSNQLAVGEGEWRKTFNKEDPNNPKTKIVKIGEGETGVNRIYLFIIAVAVIVATILLTIFG
jgi:hypothetical protein